MTTDDGAEHRARLLLDILNDRRQHSSFGQLAFEAASLRAFMFSILDTLTHIQGHIERNEIKNRAQMQDTLNHLIQRIQNNMANLEDVRIELQRTHDEQQRHND